MSGSETVYPPFFSPVIKVFVKALILAEEESVPEVGVDHFLAALDSPTAESRTVEQATGPFVPAPNRDKALSSEAKAVIEAAGADLEQSDYRFSPKGTSRSQAWAHKVTESVTVTA